MMECRGCGKHYEDGISFCRECGAPLVSAAAEHQADSGAERAAQNEPIPAKETQTVSVGEWVLVMLLPLIPCVGWLVWLVMMFVWGFGDGAKPSKRTYARASLIIALVVLVLILVFILLSTVAGVTFSHLMDEIPNRYHYRYHYYY